MPESKEVLREHRHVAEHKGQLEAAPSGRFWDNLNNKINGRRDGL